MNARSIVPGMLCVALLLDGVPARSQEPWFACGYTDRMTEHGIAEQYAPSLYFWKEELDLPTFAFADALDGRSQGDDPAVDFHDADEVVPFVNSSGTRVDWDALDAGARVRVEPDESNQYVFYRVRCAGARETDLMERFLRKDAQAWNRTDLEAIWSRLGNRALVVVEYYFYYLNDRGIQGHPQDVEFMFIFLPNDTELRDHLAVIVGAGHSPRTPNGVLVLQPDSPLTRVYAAVEYGGHATVPLRDGSSQFFRYAYDTNWHVPDTWGPRDVMAVSGEGFSGAYSTQLSFWRDYIVSYHADQPKYRYRLAPAAVFASLFTHIAGRDEASIIAALDTLSLLWNGAFAAPDSLSAEVMQRLELWPRGFEVHGKCCAAASKHQPWLHRHYLLEPSLILKDHLYRPARWNGLDLITWGGTVVGGESMGPYLGLVVPVPYLPLYVPGALEVGIGVVTTDRHSIRSFFNDSRWTPFIALTYDNSYRDLLTWFMRATWTHDPRGRLDIDARAFSLSLGPSILLWSSDRRNTFTPTKVANAIRIRVGPRFYPKQWDDLVHRTALEVSVSFRQ